MTIATPDGHKVSLTHLGPLLVRRGDAVSEGMAVAARGSSGDPEHDTPYVHLGIRTQDSETYVDPATLLPDRAALRHLTSAPAPPPVPEPTPARRPRPRLPPAAQPPSTPTPERRTRLPPLRPSPRAARRARGRRPDTTCRRRAACAPSWLSREGSGAATSGRRAGRIVCERAGGEAAQAPSAAVMRALTCRAVGDDGDLLAGPRVVGPGSPAADRHGLGRAACRPSRRRPRVPRRGVGRRDRGSATTRPRRPAGWGLGLLAGLLGVSYLARRRLLRERERSRDSLSFAAVSGTETPRKILVAVAWPYASGPRHIGHVAGFGVPSDTFARYHRLRGNDVLMVSGTDEHGTPVMVAADAAGESPRETAERFSTLIREDLRDLGLSYDLFTRTTTRNHYRVTQDLFRTLYEKGYVVERGDAGRVLRLDGPGASGSLRRGDVPDLRVRERARRPVRQLRQPARPGDLIDPRSRIDGEPPVFETTKHLFLDLPAFQGPAHGVDRVEGRLAAERQAVLAQLREGAEAASDHAGSRLGRAHPGPGVRGPGRQADLRLVRRGHRVPVGIDRVGGEPRHPRRLARVVAEPRGRARVLHGEGQHRLPHE